MTILFGFLVILRTLFATEKKLTMIESLKYIDSSLFFPANNLIKIAGSFLVGMFLFGEFLKLNEFIFLIIGLLSVLLLGYKKSEFNNKDFKKGIFLMIFSSLFLIGTSTINKYIGTNESVPLYMLLCSVASIIYIYSRIKFKKHKIIVKKSEVLYAIMAGIIGFLGFLFLLSSLKDGKIVIVHLILTITVLIPIILSYIFLREEVNKYRIMGLLLFFLDLIVFYIYK